MKRHPEVGDTEVFIGNFTNYDFLTSVRYETKRKGARAYDIDGLDITHMGVFPAFVEENETRTNGVVVDDNRNIFNHVLGLVYDSYGVALYVSRKGPKKKRQVYLCDRYGHERVLDNKSIHFSEFDYIAEVTDWLNANKHKLNAKELIIVSNIVYYDPHGDIFKPTPIGVMYTNSNLE